MMTMINEGAALRPNVSPNRRPNVAPKYDTQYYMQQGTQAVPISIAEEPLFEDGAFSPSRSKGLVQKNRSIHRTWEHGALRGLDEVVILYFLFCFILVVASLYTAENVCLKLLY
jgi:hypothetical protein